MISLLSLKQRISLLFHSYHEYSSIRLFFFKYLTERWHGYFNSPLFSFLCRPFSISLALLSNETSLLDHLNDYPKVIFYPFVINETVYPINTLRNIAIRGVQTSHFFLSDMDFWPSSIQILLDYDLFRYFIRILSLSTSSYSIR